MRRGWSLPASFSFIRGNVLVLTISGSLGMFCRGMVFPYIPLYILTLGGDPAHVGLVYALGPLGGLIVFPIAGHLTDHMDRARLIALTGYFSAAVVLINALAPSWADHPDVRLSITYNRLHRSLPGPLPLSLALD